MAPPATSRPKGRAAAQHHGVDHLDQTTRIERIGLARAGRAAADVDRAHGGGLRQDTVTPLRAA